MVVMERAMQAQTTQENEIVVLPCNESREPQRKGPVSIPNNLLCIMMHEKTNEELMSAPNFNLHLI